MASICKGLSDGNGVILVNMCLLVGFGIGLPVFETSNLRKGLNEPCPPDLRARRTGHRIGTLSCPVMEPAIKYDWPGAFTS